MLAKHGPLRGDSTRCAMDEADSWTCPTCRVAVATPYCPGCGERRLQARDLTLRGLLHQVLQSFTNLDARLLRSLRLSLIHISEPTRLLSISYAVFCLK